MMTRKAGFAALVLATVGLVGSANAGPFFFSTGNPDGLIGTLARPGGPGAIETETADDFILSQTTNLDSATFTGLIPAGLALSDIMRIEIEFYRVFPLDSVIPPSGNVLTRVNSPSDVEFSSATRDSADGSLNFSASLLNSNFSVANTVVNGINTFPNQFTGGEGPAIGQEVLLNITFNYQVVLPADHYFFRPEVELTSGNFLWLSAPKPITTPSGTPFKPDLQSWIRNGDLKPDWSRIGSDITHAGPFNAAFSLTGVVVPEPSSFLALLTGLPLLAAWRRKRCLNS